MNSVRVSNELGAGDFKAAKFSVIVVSLTSIFIGLVAMVIVLTTRDYFPQLFTSSDAVAEETTKLAVLLGITVLLNSLQPVLSGKSQQKLKHNQIMSPFLQLTPFALIYKQYFFLGSLNN
jgi:Na+-driven multidrug efflux pump